MPLPEGTSTALPLHSLTHSHTIPPTETNFKLDSMVKMEEITIEEFKGFVNKLKTTGSRTA